jgi:lysophospholipase L1-like esterase
MHNNGIGANVISPRSPAHDRSRGPSAMERYFQHVIAFRPELVLFSYGLNDARGGTPITQFVEDTRQIVADIKGQTGAVMVVVSTYFMTAFEFVAPWDKASLATLMGFNAALKRMAEELDVLYADVFDAQGLAPWMIDPGNGVHPNDLGHRVIADRISAVLAQNCSCLAQKSFELRKSMQPWRQREKDLLERFFEKLGTGA